MQKIYTTKPENRSSVMLLLMFVSVIALILFIICRERPSVFDMKIVLDLIIVIALFFFIIGWLYIILDEAVWQLTGIEECECSENGIVINKRRLFRRKKNIPWDMVSNIALYNPPKIWKAFSHVTIAGITQDTIIIKFRDGRKYRCGSNLKPSQAQKIVLMLNHRMNTYTATKYNNLNK